MEIKEIIKDVELEDIAVVCIPFLVLAVSLIGLAAMLG